MFKKKSVFSEIQYSGLSHSKSPSCGESLMPHLYNQNLEKCHKTKGHKPGTINIMIAGNESTIELDISLCFFKL